jgi:hypothetical protein
MPIAVAAASISEFTRATCGKWFEWAMGLPRIICEDGPRLLCGPVRVRAGGGWSEARLDCI